MTCGECGKNEASFHYKANNNGVISEKHLCIECAKKNGFSINQYINTDLFNIGSGGMLGELLGGMIVQDKGIGTIKEAGLCPFCGMRIHEFMQSGKAGCAKCYTTFRKTLSPAIQKIHGNTVHMGKVPSGHAEKREKRNKLDSLKEQLEKAIADQEYELAATLRDKIKEFNENEDKEGIS